MTHLEYSTFRREVRLQNARDDYVERRGIYIRCNGSLFGEAAPLPGFSKESVEDCLQELLDPQKKTAIFDLVNNGIGGNHFLPALRFALESIYYSSRPDNARGPLFCSALLAGFPSDSAVLESGIAAIERGFRHLKLKIAAGSGLDSLLTLLQSHSVEPLFFRLDANYSLNPEQTRLIAKNLSVKNLSRIEYLEDPYPNFQTDQYDFPLAIDQDIGTNKFLDINLVYVVKPSIQFGLVELASRLADAKSAGVRVILSSSLESEVGLVSLRNFCRQFADLSLAHGLSTAGILSNSELADLPRISEKSTLSETTLSRLHRLNWQTV